MIVAQNIQESDGSDSEYYSANDSEMDEDCLTSDAVTKAKECLILITDLTARDVQIIDCSLDLSDKISLVFLLYKCPHLALQQIILLLQNAQLNVIHEWYQNEKKNDKWNEQLIEALAIIQNYAILRKLGFKKSDMICRFLPLQQQIYFRVDRLRKSYYRVCEYLNKTETKRFLDYLEADFEKLKCMPQEQKRMMDLLNLQEDFEALHNEISKKRLTPLTTNYNVDRTPVQLSRSVSCFKETDDFSEIDENQSGSADDIYEINPKYPGLLLIINNQHFYTDYRDEYIGKLPNTSTKLENRRGSEEDKKKLEETFAKLKFCIEIKENLAHDCILEELEKVVRKFMYSCLVVAILSHGDQGVIYGSNSVAIEVTEIQKRICDKRLSGKPKVLLLQACQGSDCQKINDDDNYEADGPKIHIPPKTTDLLTFRATIPGYSAVRHIKRGTWFIQEFCKAIDENSNDHIQDICTKVIRKVSQKAWGEKCMVPLIEHTFTKRDADSIGCGSVENICETVGEKCLERATQISAILELVPVAQITPPKSGKAGKGQGHGRGAAKENLRRDEKTACGKSRQENRVSRREKG
ncbi:cysteine-type endopeptidase [Trypoxylus dichotomus]